MLEVDNLANGLLQPDVDSLRFFILGEPLRIQIFGQIIVAIRDNYRAP